MPDVTVVTDTTHYLPRDLLDAQGVRQVSLYVNEGGTTTRESDMADFSAFYERLRSASDLPTTSQPSIGDFLEVYEPLIEPGQDIVSVHLSGSISGTVAAAEQARQAIVERGVEPARIAVLDSETACAGLGMVAMAAANGARAGDDVERAAERAEGGEERHLIRACSALS